MFVCGVLLLALMGASEVATRKVPLQEDCGRGPEFWCQNLLTAVKCGAVEHCLKSVWNVKLEGVGNLCDDCKLIVTTVGAMVQEGSVQDGIKSILHRECNLIPVKSLVLSCQVLVDKYISNIMNLLEGLIKPDAVCDTVGLCKADQSKSTGQDLPTNQVLDKLLPLWKGDVFSRPKGQTMAQDGQENDFPIPLPLCWICRSFIGRLESAIPKDAIAKSATQLCLMLPSKIAGVCQCLVEKYTIILLDLILGKLGPQLVCGLVFLCVTEENCGPEMPLIPALGKGLTCDTCVAVTALVKSSVSENATRLEMEAALINACNSHHLDWHECQRFIQHHQLELFSVLSKPWDDETTCQEIGACATTGRVSAGPGGCSLGPAYWCLSLAHAVECKAVEHCKSHVWG